MFSRMFRSTNATNLGVVAIFLAVCALSPPSLRAQTATEPEIRRVTRGPFAVGPRPRKLTVEIATTERIDSDHVPWYRDSFVVFDRRGKEILRRDDPVSNTFDRDTDMNVVPGVVPLPGGGSALLIMKSYSPAAPGSGVDGQLFGFTMKGDLVPITGIISPDLNDTEASAFHVVRLETDGSSRLVVEVKEWTGNFIVLRHYPIDPEGVADDGATALDEERYGVRIDEKEAAERRQDSELEPVVTLRSAPRWDAPGEPCVFARSPTIEFLDAVREETRWWLHVKINGREGYVSDESHDLDRLGLESAG